MYNVNEAVLSDKVFSHYDSDTRFATEVIESLAAFTQCDWGIVPPEISERNDGAFFNQGKIFAIYMTYLGLILIITDVGNAAMNVIFSDELT